jgi:hypothetical protein
MQGRLREQGQGIGLLLGHRGRFRGNVPGARGLLLPAGPLIQALAGGGQGLHDQRSHLRLEPPSQDHHAVLVLRHVQGAGRVPMLRLPHFGPPIHAPPAAYDPLDVGRRARAPHPQQPGLRLRRGHAGEGADLGIGQLPAAKGLGEEGQRPEGARHPDPFPGRAQVEPHPPGRAGAEARVPAAARVECSDEIEQARGGGVEVRGQLGDLVAEPVQLRGAMRSRKHSCRMDLHGESSSY